MNDSAYPTPDFQRLFENAPDLYLLLRPDSPRYTIAGASQAYLIATLTAREQIMGRGLFAVFPDNPDDLEANGTSNLQASLDRVVASRKPDAMPLQKYDVNPDGRGFVEKYWSPLNTPVLNAAGEVEFIIHRVEDVTDAILTKKREAENQIVLDAVLDAMPSGVVVADMQGRVLINNASARAISHVATDDISDDSHDWPDLYGARAMDGSMLRYEEIPLVMALSGVSVEQRELLIRNERNGEGVFVEANARPLRNTQGEQIGAVVVFTDIDARKRAEQALQLSEASFRSLATNTPGVAMRARNVPGWPMLYLSERMEALTGYTAKNFVENGLHFADLVLPEDRPALLEAVQAQIRRNTTIRNEYRIRHADGSVRWIESAANLITLPDGTEVLEGLLLDASERKQAEAAIRQAQIELEQSEARFRMMTDATPQVVWTASDEGDIEFVNQSGIEYFGMPLPDLRGYGWIAAVHADDLQTLSDRWSESLSSGRPVEVQYRIRRYDGEYRWHISRGVSERDEDGRPRRWYGTTTDVEDLRRAQAAAEAAAEAKSQFLANMSHEIRTPMNGVIGMTSLLQSTELDDAQHEYVSTIRASGEHLLALINDILDFSKAEAGKLEIEHYVFDLRGCIEEAMELVADSASRKSLELILEIPPGLPRHITGDAGRLRQVLVNLLSNAIKFTAEGEVLVRVVVSVQAQADGVWRLLFAVKDSGIGIPPNRMDRLFGIFSQVDPSHTRTYGGSGLGLAICKRLVERMNGRIWAESTEGAGSTFWFEIEAHTAPEEIAPTTVNFDGKRVLVVDDNATNRRVLRLMLESWGLEVLDAEKPLAALRLLAHETFDVALLDFQMPQMTGAKLARVIRTLPNCATLPLMLLGSISGDDELVDDALFVARMLKPVRQSTLFDQLAVLFGHQQRMPSRSIEADGIKPGVHRPLRILVAEDNSVNQKVALRFLEKLGYSADLVANGQEAVQAVERQDYDVVLMDVQMPEMDGLDATRIIRHRMNPGPRIIAITANALAGDEQRCREAGMDDYISKPIDLRALAAALARTPQMPAPPEPAESADSDEDDYRPDMLARLAQVFEADGARELIETMMSDLHDQLAEMRLGLREHDPVRAGRVAHSLKSTVQLLGASALGQRCEETERAFRDGHSDRAAAAAAEITRRYQALITRLHESLPDDWGR